MALAQTDLPDLKRFTFFVSRRFEEGRERFRLHMGYFATLAEAEEWLAVVREIYPGAWAGEAPGRKLRERAAAAAAAPAPHAAGPQPRQAPPVAYAPASPIARAAPPVPVISASIPVNVPIVHAPVVQAAPAPVARTIPPVAATPARAVPPKVAPSALRPATPAPAPRAAAPAAAATPPARTAPARPAPAAPQPAPQAAVAASRAAPPPGRKGVFEDSNVREVLAALGDASATGETRLMRTPPPRVATPEPKAAGSLSDTQVLKLLETRGAQAGQQTGEDRKSVV
jgi:hypothetical protein